jgi:coproporphyrinogen III oxidase-like Fe-S oxidoreductase
MNTESQKKKVLQLFKARGVKANEFYPLHNFMEDAGVPGDELAGAAIEELKEAGLLREACDGMILTEKGAEAVENL